MRASRGSALLQVLIGVVVVGALAAAIARMTLQPALNAANLQDSVTKSKAAESAINRVSRVWTAGGLCRSDASAGVSCSGTRCSCRCQVTGGATVTAAPSGGACVLTADMP